MGVGGTLVLALLALAAGTDAAVNRVPSVFCDEQNDLNMTIYDFEMPDIDQTRNISLAEYTGKQEPGANATEILNGVKYVRPGGGFEPNFQMFAKVETNGETETPLYTFLKSQCPSTRDGHSAKDELLYNPLKNTDIRWNFEKFLIDKAGQPYKRYDPSTNPLDIEEDISSLLAGKRDHFSYQVEPKRPKIHYRPVVKPPPKSLPSRSLGMSTTPAAAMVMTAAIAVMH